MLIVHVGERVSANGGLGIYVERLAKQQRMAGEQTQVVDALDPRAHERVAEAVAGHQGSAILHLHTDLPVMWTKLAPWVRTMHGHEPYCVSGSQFLARSETACPKVWSPLGCARGHLMEHCGSLRPQQLARNLRRLYGARQMLPTTDTIVVSDFLRSRMLASGYPADRVHVLRLPVPLPDDASPPAWDGQLRVLFGGRLTVEKGAVWCAEELSACSRPLQVDVVGEGPVSPDLRRLLTAPSVRFHGWVDHARMDHLYRQAHLVLIPSLWHEPGATMVSEAFAFARGVVASDVGGISELLHLSGGGTLVAPGVTRALATVLDNVGPEVRTWGAFGRAFVEQEARLDEHAERVGEVYLRALARSR